MVLSTKPTIVGLTVNEHGYWPEIELGCYTKTDRPVHKWIVGCQFITDRKTQYRRQNNQTHPNQTAIPTVDTATKGIHERDQQP
jgi:hypothetical protein